MKIPQKIQSIIDELIDQYEFSDKSDRPWIIGFSGGKDSTVLLTLVWMSLQKLRETIPDYKFKRTVYVVCNDTLVENPIIVYEPNTYNPEMGDFFKSLLSFLHL